LSARKSRSAAAKNREYAFSDTFSAAGRRQHLIARFVQSSARPRWNLLPRVNSGRWSRSPARRLARSRSGTQWEDSRRCAPTAISFALRVRSAFVSTTNRRRLEFTGFADASIFARQQAPAGLPAEFLPEAGPGPQLARSPRKMRWRRQ